MTVWLIGLLSQNIVILNRRLRSLDFDYDTIVIVIVSILVLLRRLGILLDMQHWKTSCSSPR